MNLYLLSQDERRGYNTYDACVVAAENEDKARCITPDGSKFLSSRSSEWARIPYHVDVELIGEAVEGIEKGVILASYNAG